MLASPTPWDGLGLNTVLVDVLGFCHEKERKLKNVSLEMKGGTGEWCYSECWEVSRLYHHLVPAMGSAQPDADEGMASCHRGSLESTSVPEPESLAVP